MKIDNLIRNFLPGSCWLYYKVYSGVGFLDKIVTDELYSLINKLSESMLIDNFFYVRYLDNIGHHLRIRLHLIDKDKNAIIIKMFHDTFKLYCDNRTIYNISIDTYKRELERYGQNIDDIEYLFGADSWLIINHLKNISSSMVDNRWLGGIKIIDSLLTKFNLDLGQKYDIFENCYIAFANEFKVNKSMKNVIKKKYRANKAYIFDIMKSEPSCLTDIPLVLSDKVDDAFDSILARHSSPSSDIEFRRLVMDLIHMHFNRLFSANQRANEMIVYYMLSNYYKSSLILNKKYQHDPI